MTCKDHLIRALEKVHTAEYRCALALSKKALAVCTEPAVERCLGMALIHLSALTKEQQPINYYQSFAKANLCKAIRALD